MGTVLALRVLAQEIYMAPDAWWIVKVVCGCFRTMQCGDLVYSCVERKLARTFHNSSHNAGDGKTWLILFPSLFSTSATFEKIRVILVRLHNADAAGVGGKFCKCMLASMS